jgi:hypothetical protein
MPSWSFVSSKIPAGATTTTCAPLRSVTSPSTRKKPGSYGSGSERSKGFPRSPTPAMHPPAPPRAHQPDGGTHTLQVRGGATPPPYGRGRHRIVPVRKASMSRPYRFRGVVAVKMRSTKRRRMHRLPELSVGSSPGTSTNVYRHLFKRRLSRALPAVFFSTLGTASRSGFSCSCFRQARQDQHDVDILHRH